MSLAQVIINLLSLHCHHDRAVFPYKNTSWVFWPKQRDSVILRPLLHVKGQFIFTFSISTGPDGGIGRRARLKIWYSQGCAGSIPVPGTQPPNRWFFYAWRCL